jgi:hypothetical protein
MWMSSGAIASQLFHSTRDYQILDSLIFSVGLSADLEARYFVSSSKCFHPVPASPVSMSFAETFNSKRAFCTDVIGGVGLGAAFSSWIKQKLSPHSQMLARVCIS